MGRASHALSPSTFLSPSSPPLALVFSPSTSCPSLIKLPFAFASGHCSGDELLVRSRPSFGIFGVTAGLASGSWLANGKTLFPVQSSSPAMLLHPAVPFGFDDVSLPSLTSFRQWFSPSSGDMSGWHRQCF